MMTKELARLFATLGFKVDTTGLDRFQAALSRVEKQMQGVLKKAEALEKKLTIKPKVQDVKAKRDNSVRQSLEREYKLERAAQAAKRDTFKAELEGQKLKFAAEKQSAMLASSALRDKQAMAVLAAKEAKATQERLKAEGLVAKNAHNVAAAKLRQERLERILGQAQSRTYILQQKALQSLSATAKAELVLQHIRERGARAVEQHQARQATHAAREQRQQVRAAQQLQRHEWASARHQVWQANQARKQSQRQGNVVFDMAPMLTRLGLIGAAVGSVAAAVALVGQRLDKVQERVSGNEQYANTLEQAGGSNPANQKLAKDAFIHISDKYGTSADLESAKAFRTFVMSQTAGGKMGLQDAINMFETQSAAFRGAGMSKEESRRASLQLQQVRAKTKGDAEDVQTFAEAGPLLIEPIKRAWAERNKFKGDAQALDKAFRNSTKEGNLLAVDFEKGLERFVRDNGPSIEKQAKSIEANQTRLDNEKLLQQFGLDQNAELKASINDRIKAERELNEAMKPLRETIGQWDTALQSSTASMLTYFFKAPSLEKLEKRVEDAREKAEATSKFSPMHPARMLAESELNESLQALADAKTKAGLNKPEKALQYLLTKPADDKSTDWPDFKKFAQPAPQVPSPLIVKPVAQVEQDGEGIAEMVSAFARKAAEFQATPLMMGIQKFESQQQPTPLVTPVNSVKHVNNTVNLGGITVTVEGGADEKTLAAIAPAVESAVDRKFDRIIRAADNGESEIE
ncbi:tape measure protein [Pseudomonas sp. BN411]|uniref:tape measure protein n=1 Tax=Pseudomonas sp. BN411 TaxID=2567887 RepID=UPI0024576A2D|nr:tape measure protein [Pseudomonas sp. BN411]MDH4562151.1 hypothetical protein [Pseudomonas sp. BN411]